MAVVLHEHRDDLAPLGVSSDQEEPGHGHNMIVTRRPSRVEVGIEVGDHRGCVERCSGPESNVGPPVVHLERGPGRADLEEGDQRYLKQGRLRSSPFRFTLIRMGNGCIIKLTCVF